jgi:conjugative transfer signal peptidase TraF
MSFLPYGTAESRVGSLDWRLEIKRLEAARGAGQLLGGLVFAAALLIAFGDVFGLLIANTDSAAPTGLYRIVSDQFARGDLVAACLPIAIAQQGLARGYLRTGACPGGAEAVGKIAGALPGDLVEIERGFVTVNGVGYTNSAVAMHDSAGRPLPHVTLGKHVVSPNEVWLFGFNDRRSWDSRYFGPIPLTRVRGKLAPVLTW